MSGIWALALRRGQSMDSSEAWKLILSAVAGVIAKEVFAWLIGLIKLDPAKSRRVLRFALHSSVGSVLFDLAMWGLIAFAAYKIFTPVSEPMRKLDLLYLIAVTAWALIWVTVTIADIRKAVVAWRGQEASGADAQEVGS